MSGLTAIARIAPFASLPSLIYWVCKSLTRSRATLLIVSNSVLKNLPNVLVAAPEYLKYSPIENLFFSREFVKESVVVFTFFIVAENCPVLFMLFISDCCICIEDALAAAPDFAREVWKAEICR